jgi:hypothetical protein
MAAVGCMQPYVLVSAAPTSRYLEAAADSLTESDAGRILGLEG